MVEPLTGGGVCGALMRELDWAKTPVGPVAGWPAALRSTVSTMLHSRHPMFLWWGAALTQFYNDAYLPSFGVGKHPRAMGQAGAECWPEIWPVIGPQIRDVMERGVASWHENQLVPIYRNGRLEDVYWTYGYSPVFGDDGKIAGTLVVCTETTREVVAREAAEQSRREAELARQRLATFFHNAPAFVCTLVGPRHVYEMVNEAYERLVGKGRKLIGLPVAEALPEVVEQGFVTLLDGVYQTGKPWVGRETRVQLARAEGALLDDAWVDFTYQPRLGPGGEVQGIDTFGYDVTEQVRARQRAESLASELKLEGARKDEFLAMLAHELRNPLAAISMSLHLLERTAHDDAKAVRHRETARRQMTNLVRIVDDLLDVSRITRGTVELRKEFGDLRTVVDAALAATRAAVEARQHRLLVEVGPERLPVFADLTRLEQVVVNLVTNSTKYTEAGGTLTVRAWRDGPHAVVSVADDGRGIPPQMLDRIFDLFVQVSPNIDRSTGGLGLGLTLVKQLVERHGGTVRAKSEGAGKGTEVVVRLPLALDDDAAPHAPRLSQPA